MATDVYKRQTVNRLFQHSKHCVVHLCLCVIWHIVGLGNTSLHICLERHVTISISIRQRQKSIVDARDVKHVFIAVGSVVELECSQKCAIFRTAVIVKMSPPPATPTIGITKVGRFLRMFGLVVSHIACIDIMTKIGRYLIVVVISFIQEVTKSRGGTSQVGLTSY